MRFPVLIIATALATALAFPLFAGSEPDDLGTPIVELMPHVKKLRNQLDLSRQQQATLDAWAAEAPASRRQLEGEVQALRHELREAVLADADRMTHERLKKALAAKQTRLIEMRVLCTRMLRQTLDADQFARVVASYRAGRGPAEGPVPPRSGPVEARFFRNRTDLVPVAWR